MTEPTRGNYDTESVNNIDTLRSEIKRMYESDDPAGILADLLMNGHDGVSGYLTFGNNKVAKNTGIFNMNSATDCPNAGTTENNHSDTGLCQVEFSDCYAHKSENVYPDALKKRRLQEYLWDCSSPDIFAEALLRVKSRKRSPFKHLRVSESGDFRHNGDVMAWETIAEKVSDEINVYTYSASHKLSAWDKVEHFTVNQSNALADFGDRQFTATFTDENGKMQPITEPSEVPEDMMLCPFEAAKINGLENDERPKCGDCTACIEPKEGQSKDVAIIQH
jgi:hypothetical protein